MLTGGDYTKVQVKDLEIFFFSSFILGSVKPVKIFPSFFK